MIYPIPDESMWVRTPYDQLMPPPLRRPPGRPKRLRNKALDEPQNPHQVRRFHQSLRCKYCGEIDHNIRTCKGSMKPKKKVFHVGGRGNRARGASSAGGSGNRGIACDVGGRGRGVAGAGGVLLLVEEGERRLEVELGVQLEVQLGVHLKEQLGVQLEQQLEVQQVR